MNASATSYNTENSAECAPHWNFLEIIVYLARPSEKMPFILHLCVITHETRIAMDLRRGMIPPSILDTYYMNECWSESEEDQVQPTRDDLLGPRVITVKDYPSLTEYFQADVDLSTVMRSALSFDDMEVVMLLLDAGYPIDGPKGVDETGFCPLVSACNSGLLKYVDFLLERGANPNAKGAENARPIAYAVYGCDTKNAPSQVPESTGIHVVEHLIDHGGDMLKACDGESLTLLHFTAIHGLARIAQLLVSAGYPLTEVDHEGLAPYERAKKEGTAEKMQCLMV